MPIIFDHSRALDLISLGGEKKPLENYQQDFKQTNGFAIGRSLFEDFFISFLQNKISLDEISEKIVKNYLTLPKLRHD